MSFATWPLILTLGVSSVHAAPETKTQNGQTIGYKRSVENGRLVFRTNAEGTTLAVGDHVVIKRRAKAPEGHSERGCKDCGFACAPWWSDHKWQKRTFSYDSLKITLTFVPKKGTPTPLETSPWGGDVHFIAPSDGQLVPPSDASMDDVREQAKRQHNCAAEGEGWEDEEDEPPAIKKDGGKAGFQIEFVVCKAGIDPAAKGCS